MAVITRLSDREREASRRSALGSVQGPTDEQQAGLGIPNFYRVDPLDPTTPSFPFLRRMRRDHMIAMGRHFIDSDVLSAPWWMDGDDAQVQAYGDKLLRPIYVELALAYLRIMDFGYSDGVKNYKTAQPSWTYFEGGVAKKVWDNGTIDAIVYDTIIPLEPEDSQISWDSNGKFNGIQYDKRYNPRGGSFIINGIRTPNIDAIHAWWATHAKPQEANNPYGYPRIAHCAPIFWMYRWIWDLIARGFENSFDPGPVMRFPSDEVARTSSFDGSREEPRDAALRTGSKRRTGSTIALPSDQYKDMNERANGVYKWSIDYPKNDTDFSAVMEFIGYLESAKLVGLFLPDQSLREGNGSSSSRNVAAEFGDQRSSSQNVDIGQMHTWMMDTFIAPVIQMVFPFYQGELSIKSVGAGGEAGDLLRQVFQLTGQQDFKRFGIDLRRLAEANGFPMLDPVEQEKELKEAANQAAATPPPVEPTQGRRALVTQSGFGQMAYHRIEQRRHSPIEFLSRDGDFVASLPRSDAFADATVVAHARDLRRVVERALIWAGRDLARHVGRTQDLSRPDGVVRAWVPDMEELDGHIRAVRDSIEDVVERAGGELVSGNAFDVRFWTDTCAARSMSESLTSLREQGVEIAAESQAQGSTSRATGQAVRAALELSAQAASSTIARLDAARAYNYGVLKSGVADGVTLGQTIDPCHAYRHGRIEPLDQLMLEQVNEPTCTMTVRLLPKAPMGLSIRREKLEHDLALYDEETATVLIDLAVDREAESAYLLALGEKFR